MKKKKFVYFFERDNHLIKRANGFAYRSAELVKALNQACEKWLRYVRRYHSSRQNTLFSPMPVQQFLSLSPSSTINTYNESPREYNNNSNNNTHNDMPINVNGSNINNNNNSNHSNQRIIQ